MTHQAEGSQRTPEFDLDLFDSVVQDIGNPIDGRRVHSFREPIRNVLAERDALREQLAAMKASQDRYEYLRTLKPVEFHQLWNYCFLTDKRFDDVVDTRVAAIAAAKP